VLHGIPDGGVGRLEPRLAGDVVDPPHDGAGVALGGDAGVLDRLGVGLDRYAHPHAGERRHGELGVANPLCRKALDDLTGEQVNVLGCAQQGDGRQVDIDEVRKIGEGEEVLERREVLGHTGIRVACGERGHRLRARRADVVDVQLGLGQAGNEICVCRALTGRCRVTHGPQSDGLPTLACSSRIRWFVRG
jgi:hypothetical protein